MTLSIIITCYNEAKSIRENLRRVESVILPDEMIKEIIIVDDCSTDGSPEILRELANKYKIIFHEKNLGKGGALRTGIKKATGDFIVIQDADLELDPNELPLLLEPMLKGKCDLVLGSRFLGKSFSYLFNGKYYKYFLANKLITWFFDIFYFVRLTDVNCGYKMAKAPVFKSIDIKANSFDIEVEILAKMAKRGYHICEVPVSYQPRTAVEGKKIRLKHAFMMIKNILYNRFNS